MNNVKALVAISFGRTDETENKEVRNKVLGILGVELTASVDSLQSKWSLAQKFYESEQYINTSFGPMWFSDLTDSQNNMIYELWINSKVDIEVSYILNKEVDGAYYYPHSSFLPDEVKNSLIIREIANEAGGAE